MDLRPGGTLRSATSAFRGIVPRAGLPSLPDPEALQFWMGPNAHLLHCAIGSFSRCERLRRVRTRTVQRSAAAAKRALHLADGDPGIAARNARLPRFAEEFGWIHAHDALAAVGQSAGAAGCPEGRPAR